METKNAFLAFAILVIVSVLFSGCISNQGPGSNQTACTEEAKLCPDGSAVGRTGPNCEFAPCPQLVGNDSDIHGCKASAGYSWCEAKQKCIRIWEENCTANLCVCPEGYVQEGEACNPQCYYSTPKCLMPSIQCKPEGCGECPQYMPPGPDFCKTGKIVPGETDRCGCVGPPKCKQDSGMANPAATNCIDKGYDYSIRTDENGSQYGVCYKEGYTECDEWALYRGECEVVIKEERNATGIPPRSEGQFCGGIAAIRCQEGLACKLEATYPDAGGSCVKECDCSLMTNGTDVACFGCAYDNETGSFNCRNATSDQTPYVRDPNEIGIPYACYCDKGGCALAQ